MRSVIAALLFSCSFLNPAVLAAVAEPSYESRIRDAELAGNREQVAALCREWYASGDYSVGALNWNYNALMSVDDNAILFTHTDSDTYPAMMLQYALAVRPDVTILNVPLLENPQYREFIVRTYRLNWVKPDASMPDFIRQLAVSARPADHPVVPTYLGVMSNQEFLRADRANMYLTGLALKYSDQPFDNISVLLYNFENRFRNDYLVFSPGPEKEPETVARMNLNYIPALLLLHRHYRAGRDLAKASRIENLALRIGQTGHRENDVRLAFGLNTPAAGKPAQSAIPVKSLEKAMKRIGNTQLYAGETEVTNSQYELFLADLLNNRDFDRLGVCRIEKTDWRSLLPEPLRLLPDAMLFKNGHPDGPDMPVQNISLEAAQHYCEWITQVYNTATGRKKFKKVRFRLPSPEEWSLAAAAGRKDVPYPWGGYFIRNSKGCYLLNINATEPCGDCPNDKDSGANDGGFFTVPGTSYFPNDFGLYCMSGNVAEMTGTPGVSMGGSFQDIPYYAQINTQGKYSGSSPTLGFRVFMEIIEE